MARFTPQDESEHRLAASLGAAADDLRAVLEREAAEIINQAREQAADLEDAARRRADEVEREARLEAEQARSVESDRIGRLAEAVDALEEGMLAMVNDLRSRLNSSIEEAQGDAVEAARAPVDHPEPSLRLGAAPPEPEAPAALSEADHVTRSEGGEPGPAVAFLRPVPLSVATEANSATERNPVLDEMMRAQIANMHENGSSRADAERFLGRFRLGHSYVGLLDEIYPPDEPNRGTTGERGRRRRFSRRGT